MLDDVECRSTCDAISTNSLANMRSAPTLINRLCLFGRYFKYENILFDSAFVSINIFHCVTLYTKYTDTIVRMIKIFSLGSY